MGVDFTVTLIFYKDLTRFGVMLILKKETEPEGLPYL
jgi:hypothetical protein